MFAIPGQNFRDFSHELFFSCAKATRKWRELQHGRKRQQGTCSGRTARLKVLFPAPFFGSFFGRAKNEQEKILTL
jgi:hypothetical protein